MRAGIDSHKRTLAVAVIDDAGRQVQVEQFSNDPKGHLRLGKWLANLGVTRVDIEGSGHLGRAASAWLVDVSFDVREVPCGFTVRERRRRAGAGKSDPIDALAIARVTAREEDLVRARCIDDTTEELRILSDYRRQLVTERIRLVNRVHADLVIVVPGYKDKVPRLAPPDPNPGRPPAAARQDRGPGRADPPSTGPGRRDRPGSRRAQSPSRAGRHTPAAP